MNPTDTNQVKGERMNDLSKKLKKIEKFVIDLNDEELQYLVMVVSSEIEEREKTGLQFIA